MERRIKFLELQKIRSVAFQGERGAFSEQAAKKFFTKKISLLPHLTFEDVFNLITRKKVDAGVIPIVKLRIIHHLLANREASLRIIRSVYSQPQSPAQLRVVPALASKCSVDPVVRQRRSCKDGDAEAAKVYGLKILRRD